MISHLTNEELVRWLRVECGAGDDFCCEIAARVELLLDAVESYDKRITELENELVRKAASE